MELSKRKTGGFFFFFSFYENLLGVTLSGAEIDSWEAPGEGARGWCARREQWPAEALEVTLRFENGEVVALDGHDLPFVEGCAGWLACRLLPEPHNQQTYDLFIGEVVAAWADTRVFRDGHWQFEQSGPEWRSLHYVAGGHFYAIGDPLTVPVADD